jgi:hypothetical protein
MYIWGENGGRSTVGDRHPAPRITPDVNDIAYKSMEGAPMSTVLRDLSQKSALLCLLVLFPSFLLSQATTPTPAMPLPEDSLSPGEFTTIMKEAWSFVKEENDNYVKSIGKKTEFETTDEFEKRSVETRLQFLKKVTKYINDKKFNQRVMGVLLNASLDEYDADNQFYSITCRTVIEAPYNLPSISTELQPNPYVALADSIRKGYRTSSLYLKFNPFFRWQVVRDIAQAAKNDQGSIFFKVRFKLDLTQGDGRKGARFLIVPKQIVLYNQRTNAVYWDQNLR